MHHFTMQRYGREVSEKFAEATCTLLHEWFARSLHLNRDIYKVMWKKSCTGPNKTLNFSTECTDTNRRSKYFYNSLKPKKHPMKWMKMKMDNDSNNHS